jgi:NADH dehydrogenase/NADH:ubiquinone oxidoreductase subunit G
MQQFVTVNIDGFFINATKGNSVLDTAIESGICIPHLCHLRSVSDIGACRLCIVEHKVNGRSKVTASCTLNVKEGMVIMTNTENIRKLRRNLAELLVAQVPNSRAIQDIATRCEVKEVRYPFKNDDCVLCGRCVRFCTEVPNANAIGFVGRGKERRVDFPFGVRPKFCTHCEGCVQICPMTFAPCDGPMEPGKEYLCGKCESQLRFAEELPGKCVWCRLGESFDCARYP